MSGDAGRRAALSAGATVLEQAFDGDSLYALRSAVAAHAADAGLPRQRVYDVVTAAHELAANTVRHGAGHGRLRLWADSQALHCQVNDDGPAVQDPVRPDTAAWRREHGRGLWVIDEVADQSAWTAAPPAPRSPSPSPSAPAASEGRLLSQPCSLNKTPAAG